MNDATGSKSVPPRDGQHPTIHRRRRSLAIDGGVRMAVVLCGAWRGVRAIAERNKGLTEADHVARKSQGAPMPDYGDKKMCTSSRCTGDMEFTVRRLSEGEAQTNSATGRTASHYEAWVCSKCGHEERDRGQHADHR
jgi:hypothetical protein